MEVRIQKFGTKIETLVRDRNELIKDIESRENIET